MYSINYHEILLHVSFKEAFKLTFLFIFKLFVLHSDSSYADRVENT